MSKSEERTLSKLHRECLTIVKDGKVDEARRCQVGGGGYRCDRPTGHVGCHCTSDGTIRYAMPGEGRVRAIYPRPEPARLLVRDMYFLASGLKPLLDRKARP